MFIGIDVGGTKTHVRVEAPGAQALERRLPTRAWLQGRSLHDPGSADALLSVVADLGPSLAGGSLVVGAHGCDTPEQVEAFRAALAARHVGPVHVTNDAALVGPAAGVDRAIGVIAGTGSIVIGADAESRPVSAGGHGWMLADPGSAPGIAREAVRAVARRADSGRVSDALGIALMNHFGAGDVSELVWVFTSQADMHRWAGAAPIVFAAAEAGSADARCTIEQAADDLAHQIAMVLRRGAVAEAIVAAGGVITNQPRLAEALERRIRKRDIVHPFRVLEADPVSGAVAMARRLSADARLGPPAMAVDGDFDKGSHPRNAHTDQRRST